MNPEDAEREERREATAGEPYEPPLAEDLESVEGTVATASGHGSQPTDDMRTTSS